jgi:outer membrane protein assembly factor BamB
MRRSTFVLLGILASGSLGAASWPGWRGPGGQGISEETGIPDTWAADENIAWKTAVPGRGCSSPVVWEDRVFLTTAIEGEPIPGAAAVRHVLGGEDFVHPESVGADRSHSFRVLCLDAQTGKLLWERTAYEGRVYDNRHRKASYASPTPATDGKQVYAYFGAEGVHCFGVDGDPRWRSSVGRIATLGMGVGSSPVLHGGLVLLQCDGNIGESFIAALDAASGKEVWRARRAAGPTWATPAIIVSGGRSELVANGTELVAAYDPVTGEELWATRGIHSNAIHTPVVSDGLVFVTSGYPAKRALALRPGGTVDLAVESRVLWEYGRGIAYVVSPIAYRGLLYLVSDQGLVTCLDPGTGAVKYEGGRLPVPSRFTASPVACDGKLFLTSEAGDTFVIRAGPVHEVLRTNPLDETVYASPAISGGRVFIRGEKHLFCIGAGAG